MQGKRMDRVAHLLQMELSNLIVTRLKDPGLGFMTITHVSMTPDLKAAWVHYSVIGNAHARQTAQAALERSRGYLQRQVADSLKLRHTPHLSFRYDASFDDGLKVDLVLRDLDTQKEQAPPKEPQD